jgi:membrane protease YdiL (CAAX protease family)
MIQSFAAGFEWTIRSDINMFNLLFGLVFIFIADLGTELYTRGYPLTRFKDSFGANMAIVIMVLFVSLKSVSLNHQGELLMYIILIPAIHTIFFSIIYFKTKRLGASLGIHTGANFVTNSIFDLRESQDSQVIPSGIFESNVPLEELSLSALQMPYVVVALLFSLVCYIWWKK